MGLSKLNGCGSNSWSVPNDYSYFSQPQFLACPLITALAYVLDAHLFISMPADVPVPNGAGPSVGRVLTSDIIQNGCWILQNFAVLQMSLLGVLFLLWVPITTWYLSKLLTRNMPYQQLWYGPRYTGIVWFQHHKCSSFSGFFHSTDLFNSIPPSPYH